MSVVWPKGMLLVSRLFGWCLKTDPYNDHLSALSPTSVFGWVEGGQYLYANQRHDIVSSVQNSLVRVSIAGEPRGNCFCGACT
jgi:hypothetical protein